MMVHPLQWHATADFNPRWQSQLPRVWGEVIRRRVLVIDDDQGLSRMVALVLRRQSFDVDVANSGDDGLALLRAGRYDAVVLDLRMPGKDGRTVFREMRAAGVHSPVLILSAYDAHRAREELGSEAALDKPFEPDVLVERVIQMLDSAGSTTGGLTF
jgi:two-component system response regulator MprA